LIVPHPHPVGKTYPILCAIFIEPLHRRSMIGFRKGVINMKKTILIVSIVVAVLVVAGLSFGAAYAARSWQGRGPGGGMMGGNGGYGLIHDYVEKALADKLGLTEEQIEDQLAAGKSMYQIAIDKGVKAEDVPALMLEVHQTALKAAVADGVITQAQADQMLSRMQNGGGYGTGNCGGMNGRGGNGRGRGGWNNQP
jgi:hypothetical protein